MKKSKKYHKSQKSKHFKHEYGNSTNYSKIIYFAMTNENDNIKKNQKKTICAFEAIFNYENFRTIKFL